MRQALVYYYAICFLVVIGCVPFAQAADPLRIVTSFSILKDVVENITKETADVQSVVGPNQDAHVYELTPKDVENLQKADLVFVVGLNFEPWINRLLTSPQARAKIVVVSEGVKPLMAKGSSVPDPHVWGDLRHVIHWVRNIQSVLTLRNPGQKKIYRNNAEAYIKKLQALDNELRKAFAQIPQHRRVIITAHDAFSYFGKAYDIRVNAPQGVSTDHEPSAQELAQLIQQIKQENISTIYIENIANAKLIHQIAAETSVKVGGPLYSDALSDASGEAHTYLDLYRHNARLFNEGMK